MKSRDSKKQNELIRKRKKARNRKRFALFLVFLIGILILLSLKTDYFYIKKIIVENNKIVSGEEIVAKSGITEQSNILYINTKQIKKDILESSYIQEVSVERKLPNTLVISVIEREAKYHLNFNEKIFIFDKDLNILEIRGDNPLGLPEIKGLNLDNKGPGDKGSDSERIRAFVAKYTELMTRTDTPLPISQIDLTDTLNIKLIVNAMTIKIGDEDGLERKLNNAINIFNSDERYLTSSGYIDVSFNGNPVIYLEN